MWYYAVKLVFVALLFLSYLFLMAWPSIQSFLAGGVLVEVSKLPVNKEGKPQFEAVILFCSKRLIYFACSGDSSCDHVLC